MNVCLALLSIKRLADERERLAGEVVERERERKRGEKGGGVKEGV